MERDRGFLVYISRTYRAMVPYLKGIYQTLDSWRSGRSKDGWNLSPEELIEFYSHEDHEISGESEAPVRVKAVPRLGMIRLR